MIVVLLDVASIAYAFGDHGLFKLGKSTSYLICKNELTVVRQIGQVLVYILVT